VTTFLDTLHRDFERPAYAANCLLVTHGLTIRLFLMRWYHWTVEYFERLRNPRNCQFFVMELGPNDRYRLVEALEVEPMAADAEPCVDPRGLHEGESETE